jgi:NADPH2:quinone reductase
VKAVVVRQFGPTESHQVESLPDPVPGPADVVIEVEAAETNYPDVLVVSGKYQVKPPLPFTPGKGAAGRIAAVGSQVKNFAIGQRVAAQVEYGAYAEKLRTPASTCYPVPDSVNAVDAAASLLTHQTAWFALKDRARFSPGERVLVLGAGGGVGVASIQIAKALGAGFVIAGTRGTAKLDAVRAAGADAVVDLSQPNLRDGLRINVQRLTQGHGVDIVLDPIGGAAFEAALRCLAWRGRHVVMGFAGGDIPSVRANYLLVKNIEVSGLQASDYRDRCPEDAAEAQAEIFHMIDSGLFRPLVTETLPLESFAVALAKLETGRARGKIVLSLK